MTTTRTRTAALIVATMLVASIVLPAAVAAEEAVSVSVEQDGDTGEAIVTVDRNGTAVENATVTVNASGNYSAAENYSTDANGTVRLPAPDEVVNVTLSIEATGSTVQESATLIPLADSLSVGVEQSAGEDGVVTVTQYDSPVENASVTVETAENHSYAGTGDYSTDTNGTIELPAPDSTIDVSVTATTGNLTAMTTSTLKAPELSINAAQTSDGSLSIAVLEGDTHVDNGTVFVESENYTYAGSYDLENGSLTLPAPTQNVTASVTATVEDRTASTSVNLTVPTDENPNNDFAEALGRFITFMKGQSVDGPLGQEISAFVHANNPASADDDRGPPEHAGSNSSPNSPVSEDDEMDGEDAETEDRRGPPEHAGPDGEDNDEKSDDADDEATEETESDNSESTEEADSEDADAEEDDEDDESNADEDGEDRRGPPEHAGGPK